MIVLIIVVFIVIPSLQPKSQEDLPSGNGYSGLPAAGTPPTYIYSTGRSSSPGDLVTGLTDPGQVRTTANLAGFSADRTSGSTPLTVYFTDTTQGSPTKWSWNFGDGSGSTQQNPVHTFTSPGTYAVTLAVVVNGVRYEKSMTITATGATLKAAFRSSPGFGYAPFTVQFTDTSTGSPTLWSWTFGDGYTSTVRNPTHTYTTPGIYHVTLRVERDGVSSSTGSSITVEQREEQTVQATTTIPITVMTAATTQAPTTIPTSKPTPAQACSSYSYTINGRVVSGTCCGSLSSSMQCSGGVCYTSYTCNGVPIG